MVCCIFATQNSERVMIFNSFNFIIVYPIIFLLYYVIPAGKTGGGKRAYLLIVSYLLYLQWKPVYALLLLGLTVVTYFVARFIEQSKRPKRVLVAGLIVSLLPLAFFKYFNFVNNSISSGLALVGLKFALPGLNWAIPVGISFFTFQAVGYVIDVYYRRIEAERDFLTYALFVSFFPSIVSGPINKAQLMLSQFHDLPRKFDYSKVVSGLKLLLWGMFMKVVVADRLGQYVDTVMPNYMNYTGLTCVLASLYYTFQIYADFAGYSLMAIGVGRTLGFELTENFRRPYFAVSVSDFWRRWHISLSTWLKDYVYIPLGGSHCSQARNYWNIFVTFLVSGIWHGANWTFVVWGGLHGLFQIVEKALGEQRCKYGWFGRTVKTVITFVLVSFAWIFFRMPSLGDAVGVIRRMFDFSLPGTLYYNMVPDVAFSFVGVLLILLVDLRNEFFPDKFLVFENRYRAVRFTAYIAVLAMIVAMGVLGSDQFIYSNF